MKASTIQTFRKCSAGPCRIGVIRRYATRAADVSRHLTWAITLVERLLRRVLMSAMRFESMILARPAHTWIHRLQVLRAHPTPAQWQTSQEWNLFHLHQSKEWVSSTPWILRSDPKPERVLQFTAPPTLAPISSALVPRSERLRKTRTLDLLETIARRQIVRSTHEQTTSSRSLRLATAHRDFALRSRPLSVIAGPVSHTPDRILRQHRRVEERSVALDSAYKKPMPNQLFETPVFAERSRPAAKPSSNAARHAETRDVGAQAGAAVNVAQITDAVLKQIDRRLVAARERMGKI